MRLAWDEIESLGEIGPLWHVTLPSSAIPLIQMRNSSSANRHSPYVFDEIVTERLEVELRAKMKERRTGGAQPPSASTSA